MAFKKNKSKWSSDRKEKFSKQKKGIKPYEMTEEIKKKISSSCSGSNHYSAITVTIDGVKYNCKKEACQKLNLSLYQLNKLLSTYLG